MKESEIRRIVEANRMDQELRTVEQKKKADRWDVTREVLKHDFSVGDIRQTHEGAEKVLEKFRKEIPSLSMADVLQVLSEKAEEVYQQKPGSLEVARRASGLLIPPHRLLQKVHKEVYGGA